MSAVDEFLHQIKHASQQQAQDYGPFVYGHIASYDPKTNRVRVVLASVRDEDNNHVLSPWMQLGSGFAGNGYGLQVAPKGGATLEDPTAGEQVLVARIDRGQGFGAVIMMGFNQTNIPPVQDLEPGEVALTAAGGATLRLRTDGRLELGSTAKIEIICTGDAEITTQGDAKVTAAGKASITAPHIEAGNGGVLQPVKLADNTPSTVFKAQ